MEYLLNIPRLEYGQACARNSKCIMLIVTWHFGYRSMSVGLGTFQPSNGGMEISADNTHTAPIITMARTGVRFFKYSTACVMLQYRSRDIRHKFNIEAVLNRTSRAECISHLKQNNKGL